MDIDAYDVRPHVKDPEHLWVSVVAGFVVALVVGGLIELAVLIA